MLARLAVTVAASALYGFACGSSHGLQQAVRNLVKFPLLILVTSGVCALGWYVFAIFVSRKLDGWRIQRLSTAIFADLSVLLASLAPVVAFLALTLEDATSAASLGEYPLFLGLNVAAIALCGSLALIRQTTRLVRELDLSVARGAALTLAWLAISLTVGGQCAWYFRPYYGPAYLGELRFMEGTRPDYRGARSFFEAVYHLVDPPPPAASLAPVRAPG